jgi:hypothetical protein
VRLKRLSGSDGTSPPVDPRLSITLTETAENGYTEPEQVVGDSSPNRGELQDFLDAALWYDTGLANIDAFGADNGVRDIGEALVHEDADGTLATVAGAVDDVSLVPGGCLGADETVTVSFGWAFDADAAGINAAQGDSVTLDFVFDGHPCGGG